MINIFKKVILVANFLLSIFTIGMLGAPNNVLAADDACSKLKEQISNGGFDINSLPKYCTTESIYNKIINGALYAVGIVAVIAILYGGYLYMTAQDNEEQRKRGRSVLTWAVLGLVVVILAVLLVNVAVNLFTVENRFV